ncbi:MAG: pyridoxal-phosphate dependent enzyme [Pseudomonadota bacterium]
MTNLITADEIAAAAQALNGRIHRTPVVDLSPMRLGRHVAGKFEHWQLTGTFKVRGALLSVDALDARQRPAGVTAVSAGNHAIATAYAAREARVSAHVVMTASANPLRVSRCRELGAVVEIAGSVHDAFDRVAAIQRDEGRAFVHPFNSRQMLLGSGTLGAEILAQRPDVGRVVVPIGGGGLAGGIATAIKLKRPDCEVIGVEPDGAASMQRSLQLGEAVTLEEVTTIADSLGAPHAAALSFAHCASALDRVDTVTDDELRRAMRTLHDTLGFAVEPACAATTAWYERYADKNDSTMTVLLFCGSNIDVASVNTLLSAS